MWKCPKCGKVNDQTWYCMKCGYDDSKNYERYLLPVSLPESIRTNYISVRMDGEAHQKQSDREKERNQTVSEKEVQHQNNLNRSKGKTKKRKSGKKWFLLAVLGIGMVIWYTNNHGEKRGAEKKQTEEKTEAKTERETETSTESENVVKPVSSVLDARNLSGYEWWKDENENTFFGMQKDGRIDGWGICIYADGGMYEGEWKNGVKCGVGVEYYSTTRDWFVGNWNEEGIRVEGEYFWSDGSYYEGEFNGSRSGNGTQVYSNGSIYIGDWAEDQKAGNGYFIWPDNGNIYDGIFAENVRNGEGTLYTLDRLRQNGIWEDDQLKEGEEQTLAQDGQETWTGENNAVYTGVRTDGILNGMGSVRYENGNWYHGEFVNGLKDGEGIYYDVSSEYFYFGEWKEGNREGKGIAGWLSEDKQSMDNFYVATYQNDKINGEGVELYNEAKAWYKGAFNEEGKKEGTGMIVWQDGKRYIGDFANDVRDGYGIFQWPDGKRYEGQWKGDKRNGEGTMYWTDGTVSTGQWQNDEMV